MHLKMNICKLPSIILFCGMNNIIYVMFIASKIFIAHYTDR